jgi:hypothetical protein
MYLKKTGIQKMEDYKMKEKIYIVGGSKGGVGKSIVCVALIDYLTAIRNEKVYLIESDTSNPDVGRTYLKPVDGVQRLPGAAFDLDDAEGWFNFIDAAEQYSDHHVVVNSAARNGKGIAAYIDLLDTSLRKLKREVVTFWVINRERDGLELCKKYMEMAPFSTLHIVRNGYYGELDKFQLYENSKLKTVVEGQGKSLYFHELNDMVCDIMRNNNIPIADAVEDKERFRTAMRVVLERWRERYSRMFGEVVA